MIFVLKSILLLAQLSRLLFIWSLFMSFFFQLSCVSESKVLFYTQHTACSCFLIHIASPCLLIGMFGSFTFSIIAGGCHSYCCWEAVDFQAYYRAGRVVWEQHKLKMPQKKKAVLSQTQPFCLNKCSFGCCKPVVNFPESGKVGSFFLGSHYICSRGIFQRTLLIIS